MGDDGQRTRKAKVEFVWRPKFRHVQAGARHPAPVPRRRQWSSQALSAILHQYIFSSPCTADLVQSFISEIRYPNKSWNTITKTTTLTVQPFSKAERKATSIPDLGRTSQFTPLVSSQEEAARWFDANATQRDSLASADNAGDHIRTISGNALPPYDSKLFDSQLSLTTLQFEIRTPVQKRWFSSW
ncbi:hypothetical protein MKZ38_010178 [Zalerion maritima]|uniref:Uncharacterized protein n=1 Tax=Zalerion maritima TaxID=339359 RepID=A0AAD5WLW8_9PEZI|nr:hypothetical protein MKZ38_010178 [Zalerion maritima]